MASRLLCILLGLGIALAIAGSPRAAIAADPEPCQPSGATVIDVYKVGDPTKKETEVELGNKIAVQLDDLAKFRGEAACRKKSILLYVNGQATGNKYAGLTGSEKPENNALIFFLRHVGATNDFWNVLLGRPNFDPRTLHINVGIEDQVPLAVKGDKTLSLTVLPPLACAFWFAIFLALCVGFFKIARQSTILRDQLLDPAAAPGDLGAYSLSKTQGAWWFFFILASYLLIGIVTGDFSNSINSTALILLGIGAGTVLGSAAIDASKVDQRKADLVAAQAQLTAPQAQLVAPQAQLKVAQAQLATPQAQLATELAQLAVAEAERTSLLARNASTTAIDADITTLNTTIAALNATIAPLEATVAALNATIAPLSTTVAALNAKIDALNGKSVNFILDILSDGNGVNFHRFQLAAWTLVLSIIFVTQVYIELDMPTFNQTLMGLLGLSAGTYLGLKIPEPTKPTP
jgi:uncharacterized coiled-coil protein SlyX